MRRNRKATMERILHGAVEVIISRGFMDFGVNRVARAAGCDKVLMYRYFKNLNGVFRALADRAEFFPSAQMFLARYDDPDDVPGQRLTSMMNGYISEIEARPLTRQSLRWMAVTRNPLVDAVRTERDRFEKGLEEAKANFPGVGPLQVLLAGHLQRYFENLPCDSPSKATASRARRRGWSKLKEVARSHEGLLSRPQHNEEEELEDPNTLPTNLL